MLDRELIRLQCYEGLDVGTAVYEWNYSRQMLHIRLLEAAGEVDPDEAEHDLFGPEFWNGVKDRLLDGEVLHVFPYPSSKRLR